MLKILYITTKLPLMTWLDVNLGHTPSILTKILFKFTNLHDCLKFDPIAQLVELWPHDLGAVLSNPTEGNVWFFILISLNNQFEISHFSLNRHKYIVVKTIGLM